MGTFKTECRRLQYQKSTQSKSLFVLQREFLMSVYCKKSGKVGKTGKAEDIRKLDKNIRKEWGNQSLSCFDAVENSFWTSCTTPPIGHQNREFYDHFRVDDIVFTGIFGKLETI